MVPFVFKSQFKKSLVTVHLRAAIVSVAVEVGEPRAKGGQTNRRDEEGGRKGLKQARLL